MVNFFINIATVVLSGICLIAFVIVLEVFFPKWIHRSRLAIENQPGVTFLLGLVNMLFFGSITLVFFTLARSASPIFLGPALLVNTPLAAATFIGTAGLIAFTGGRLFPGESARKRTIYATTLLYIACLTPVVGWFVLTSFIAVMGFGGLLLGFLRYRNPEKELSGSEDRSPNALADVANTEADLKANEAARDGPNATTGEDSDAEAGDGADAPAANVSDTTAGAEAAAPTGDDPGEEAGDKAE